MQSLAFRKHVNQNGSTPPIQVNEFGEPISSRDAPETFPEGSPNNPPTIGPVDTETLINGVGEVVRGPRSNGFLSDEAVGFIGILFVPIVTILYLTLLVKLLTFLAGSFVMLKSSVGL